MKYKNHCDYLEIRLEENESTHIEITKETLELASKSMEKGGYIRALYKGGWGGVSFNSYDKIETCIKKAIEEAKAVQKNESKFIKTPAICDTVELNLKNDPRKITLDEKINILLEYSKLVLSCSDKIVSSKAKYNETFRSLIFANSEGSYIVQNQMDLGGAIMAFAADGNMSQYASTSFGGSNDFNIIYGLEEKIKKAAKIAVDLLSAPKVKGGEYTVITNPILTGVFAHEAFGHLSEADGLCENDHLKDIMKLGTQIGSPVLNIYDSGIKEGTRGYLKYDDEGVKTEKTYLIKNGILVGRLHSKETAAIMDEKPTGNARALSYKFPPICRMRATCIEKGSSNLQDMIKGIKLGILACSSNGGQTNGEIFTFSAQYSYMIRDGKIAELVRDVNLTGNVFTTLKNIDMIGNEECVNDSAGGCGKGEQFPLPVSMGGPYIRIQNVVVGGD